MQLPRGEDLHDGCEGLAVGDKGLGVFAEVAEEGEEEHAGALPHQGCYYVDVGGLHEGEEKLLSGLLGLNRGGSTGRSRERHTSCAYFYQASSGKLK